MLMGRLVKLKLNVVLHIFDCQPNRERAASRQFRLVAEKRLLQAEIADILMNPGCSSWLDVSVNEENTSLNILNSTNMIDKISFKKVQTHSLPETLTLDEETEKIIHHKRIQTNVNRYKHFRSKGIFCNLQTTNTTISTLKIKVYRLLYDYFINNNITKEARTKEYSGDTTFFALSSFWTASSSDWKPGTSEDVNPMDQGEI